MELEKQQNTNKTKFPCWKSELKLLKIVALYYLKKGYRWAEEKLLL